MVSWARRPNRYTTCLLLALGATQEHADVGDFRHNQHRNHRTVRTLFLDQDDERRFVPGPLNPFTGEWVYESTIERLSHTFQPR